MGWSGGTEIMNEIIAVLRAEIPNADLRCKLYKRFIEILEDRDWDCPDEPLMCKDADPAYEAAFRLLYPNVKLL